MTTTTPGKILADLRRAAGLTKEQLAREAGVSWGTISHHEQRLSAATVIRARRSVLAIADALLRHGADCLAVLEWVDCCGYAPEGAADAYVHGSYETWGADPVLADAMRFAALSRPQQAHRAAADMLRREGATIATRPAATVLVEV